MQAVKFRAPGVPGLVTRRELQAQYRTKSNGEGLLCYDKITGEFKAFATMVLTERGKK